MINSQAAADKIQRTKQITLTPCVRPIECKAGRTVAADWFKPLQDFCKASGASGSALIYGGQTNQPRSQTPVFGWESMRELIELAFRAEGGR